MKHVILKSVKAPGSRGGTYYRNAKGEIVYGVKHAGKAKAGKKAAESPDVTKKRAAYEAAKLAAADARYAANDLMREVHAYEDDASVPKKLMKRFAEAQKADMTAHKKFRDAEDALLAATARPKSKPTASAARKKRQRQIQPEPYALGGGPTSEYPYTTKAKTTKKSFLSTLDLVKAAKR